MKKYLSSLDIDVYICYSKLVEGKELEMINAFKHLNINDLKKYMRLTEKQIKALKKLQNSINRFADILYSDGIGIDTYKSIFRLLYCDEFHGSEQIPLF